jgi:hypothetical protein
MKVIANLPPLQDWTYVIRPSLEVYRCHWPWLLQHLREALLRISSHPMVLDAKQGGGSRMEEPCAQVSWGNVAKGKRMKAHA